MFEKKVVFDRFHYTATSLMTSENASFRKGKKIKHKPVSNRDLLFSQDL